MPIPAVLVEPVVAAEVAIQRHADELAAARLTDGIAYSDGSEENGGWTGAGIAVRLGGGEDEETLWAKSAATPFDPRPSSGQHIRLRSLALLQKLQATHPNVSLQLVWVPGHAEVDWNEEADNRGKGGAVG
ncbi:hypothetical protein JCM8097_003497 [Rhodosporidiobolus ruineniae]